MDDIYHTICLRLILAISRALEKLQEEDYEAAEEILRKAGREAAGETPKLPLR